MSQQIEMPKKLLLDIESFLLMSDGERLAEIMLWRSQNRKPIDEFSAYIKVKDDEVMCCPECGSGDVRFDNISVRPYCADCSHWGAVNMTGTSKDSVKAWNIRAILAGR